MNNSTASENAYVKIVLLFYFNFWSHGKVNNLQAATKVEEC